MNLKTIKVRIANQVHGQPTNEQRYEISIPEHSIEEMHGVIGRMWPDCQVDFEWWGKNLEDCFSYRVPENQNRDAVLVEEGKMKMSDYTKKWYGF